MRMRDPLGWLECAALRSARQPGPRAQELGVALDHLAYRRAEILALHGEGDVGLEKADLVAAVEAPTLEAQAVEGPVAERARERVGELDLPARTALAAIEVLHHLGLEDIAADDGKGGGCLLRLRLLDQALDL